MDSQKYALALLIISYHIACTQVVFTGSRFKTLPALLPEAEDPQRPEDHSGGQQLW